jgi:predicted nucleic acid-binding protein
MIVLDTNVVSEPLKPKPDAAVLHWLDAQDSQTLYITTIHLAELLAGIAFMPAGRKRTALKSAFDSQIMPLFDGRILPFDAKAATVFAQINARLVHSDFVDHRINCQGVRAKGD